jgi:membrane protein YdbS with pleckstrin-like domain
MLGPLIPGCIVIAFPALIQIARAAVANPAILMNALPFCVLFAVWLVIFIPVRRRRIQKLQSELDLLNRLAGSTPH